jgi:hypothetical protein
MMDLGRPNIRYIEISERQLDIREITHPQRTGRHLLHFYHQNFDSR